MGFMETEAAGGLRNPKDDEVDESGDFYRIIGYFRETNAEGQRIRIRVEEALHRAYLDEQDTALRAFEEARQVIRKEIEEARRRAAPIEKLRKTDPEQHAWFARELVQVANGWDDMDQLWPAKHNGKEPLDRLAEHARETLKVLDAIIFTCACQTIPNELDNYLKNYRIGKSLDFVATFKDQFADEASARAVLATLAQQSGAVSGLIDLESAKVIKADQRGWRQAISVAWIMAIAGAGFGLAAIAVHFGIWLRFGSGAWPVNPDQWAALNGAYLLVLLGVLGHWVLDRVKQNRAGAEVTPLAEWLMWIHINEVPITIRIATVWLIVLLGVAFGTFDLAKGVEPTLYFTAGYFVDSTFDALVGRFNTFVSNKEPVKNAAQNATA
ncbi:MAG: hypothetical protein ABR906_10895 [Terracidiphilus sp.]|jgi:hypothetical protein